MTGTGSKATFECGATEVVVADSHGSILNLLPDVLHEAAILVRGLPCPLAMIEDLDDFLQAGWADSRVVRPSTGARLEGV